MAKKCCICGKDEHHVNLLFKGRDDAYRWQSKPVKAYYRKQ